MNSRFRAHEQGHLKGDNSTHPIEPRWRTPAALLLLALRISQRRLPCRPQSSQRLAFFALSRCARAHLEPQRSALPEHPIAAYSGAFNCGCWDNRSHAIPAQRQDLCTLRAGLVCHGARGGDCIAVGQPANAATGLLGWRRGQNGGVVRRRHTSIHRAHAGLPPVHGLRCAAGAAAGCCGADARCRRYGPGFRLPTCASTRSGTTSGARTADLRVDPRSRAASSLVGKQPVVCRCGDFYAFSGKVRKRVKSLPCWMAV